MGESSTKKSILYSKSLSNGCELVEFSENTNHKEIKSSREFLRKISNTDDTDNIYNSDFVLMTENAFKSFFDVDGRLVHESKFREAIHNGGCCQSIRHDVWSFLFSLYPMLSTYNERKQLSNENHFRYNALKQRCFKLLEENGFNIDSNSDCYVDEIINISVDEDHIESQKSLAEMYAEKQKFDFISVSSWFDIVDKDIPRTDINPQFFHKKFKTLTQMRNILITFSFYHPTIGYVQGMNDILTRFLVVLESEVDAYWCFSNYIESVENDFSDTGMLEKIKHVSAVLEDLEPDLFRHFNDCSLPDLLFCHRWLLVSFKREFEYEESIRYFEIVQSQHLKFDSHEALRTQDEQYRKEIMKNQGKPVKCPSFEKVKYTLDVFVCVSVIMLKRQEFLACTDMAEVFRVACNIRGTLNLEEVLKKAYGLFLKYCKKYVQDNCVYEGSGLLNNFGNSFHAISDKLSGFATVRSYVFDILYSLGLRSRQNKREFDRSIRL